MVGTHDGGFGGCRDKEGRDSERHFRNPISTRETYCPFGMSVPAEVM